MSAGRGAWVLLRFVLFGCAGFVVLFIGSVEFIVWATSRRDQSIGPFASLALAAAGSLMMLYGTGEWGRWAYLLVFLAIPVSFLVVVLLPGAGGDKMSPALVVGASAFAIYAVVRAHYARRSKRKGDGE